MTPAQVAATAGEPVRPDQVRVFQDLYARYYHRIRAAIWTRARDWDLAGDLAQDAFVRLWRQVAAGQVDLDGIDVKFAWVMAWGRQAEFAHVKDAFYRNETTTLDNADRPDDPDLALPDPADVVADRAQVTHLLAGIPDHLRRVLVLHILDDLPLAEVAAATGLTQTEVTALVAEGITRVRDLLGVTPEQVAAQAETARAQRIRAHLSALATPPVERTAQFRTDLCAAIAAGTWSPGSLLPAPPVLARTYPARRHQIVDGDSYLIPAALDRMVRAGILTGNRASGYTLTGDGPRLAGEHTEHVPAGTALARELLAGTWPPGTRLPSKSELCRRWHVTHATLSAALDTLVELGALDRVGARYRVVCLPGVQPAPTQTPHPPDAQILAAIAATATVPTAADIKATYQVGHRHAHQLREAALLAAITAQATATGQAPSAHAISNTYQVGHALATRLRDAFHHHATTTPTRRTAKAGA